MQKWIRVRGTRSVLTRILLPFARSLCAFLRLKSSVDFEKGKEKKEKKERGESFVNIFFFKEAKRLALNRETSC